MIARFTRARGRLLPIALAALSLAGCGGATRFALRPPVLHDGDDRPFSPKPAYDEESDYANTIDVTFFGPLSRLPLAEQPGEARNVSSLDEVPDSSWFTNRAASPADLERGPCPATDPLPPFTIKSSKGGGTTPGFVVKDARGQKYMLKVDELSPNQPEISTAADTIVSRLYWAVGFNAPCNQVIFIDPADMRVTPKSVQVKKTGDEEPLGAERVAEVLKGTTRGPQGKIRLSSSLFISGEPVGTWHTEGVRGDDPNDVIPHEDRRELRGERFLAAWVAHWDSRGPNTFDTFVRSGDGGYVMHYFLDFSDSLGGTTVRTQWAEPRLGHATAVDVPQIATDLVGLGIVRRPWDEVHVDPRYPNLGYMDVAHFDPMAFAPQTPQVRWSRALPQDLAWMARRLARLGPDHVRSAVRTGHLGDPAEEARLVEILLQRREKILRASFAKTSPLADVAVREKDTFCTVDLGVETGLSDPKRVTYNATLRHGVSLEPSAANPVVQRETRAGRICVQIPHLAPAGPPDDSAERYLTVDVTRAEEARTTTLRAHFYDLGAERGHVLAGVERP